MADQVNPKLHVFLAHAGVASRRKAEVLIAEGKVKVNGQVVRNVAERVDPAKDQVEFAGKLIDAQESFVYYLLHKPAGYVSTVSDPDGKKTVTSLVPHGARIYPVGRLDLESEGLILMTNNGELAQKMTHPKYEVQKTYRVLVQGSPSYTAMSKMRQGIQLKEGRTRPAEVELFKHEHGNVWMTVTIHEGRNRQVRRMCSYVGLNVLRLVRIAFGPLELGDLAVGKWRKLTAEEESALLRT